MALVVIAIYFLSFACVLTVRYQRRYQLPATWKISSWTPPYAPNFQSNVSQITGSEFTAAAINSRRAAADAIHAVDNTEFINDLFAYRCKICSTVYSQWISAFECHKG